MREVAAANLDEERIALCSPHGCDILTAQISRPTNQRRRPRPARPVPFRMASARCAAEQNVLGQRPVNRTVKPGTASSCSNAAPSDERPAAE